MSDKDRSFVIRAFVLTLMLCSISVVVVLLAGLFDNQVDNNRIFAILAPLSQQVTGAAISILSALVAVKATSKDKGDAP